jgi:uncharacterized protein
MKCKQCSIGMEQTILAGVEVEYCPRCYGLWFAENELDLAQDKKDEDFRWLDIDLWGDPGKLQVSTGGKACPVDIMPLYEVRYGDSDIKVDVCNICHGIWLDRGEFIEVMEYLKEKGVYELLNHYTRNLFEETWEVFSGPEMLRDEALDLLAILKLLRYKLTTQHPILSQMMLALPR